MFVKTLFMIGSFLLITACNKKEAAPVTENKIQPPPAATEPAEAPEALSIWEEKMKNCPHQLTKGMTWKEVMQVSDQIKQECHLTQEEFDQMVKEKLGSELI